MRWPKTCSFLLIFLPLVPFSARALEVKFCVPSCAAEGATIVTVGPGTRWTEYGVHFTKVEIGLVISGFTITATVTGEQSGTMQNIIFNPTTIATSTTSACNTTATNPCRLEIIATSEPLDFPYRMPPGAYPRGVFMSGIFTNTQLPEPDGDTISMTGEHSGLSANNVPLGNAIINGIPGTGVDDTPVSLPSSCAGSPTCKFMASEAYFGFYDTIEETVQHICDVGASECLGRCRRTVNVEIKQSGNVLDL
jgi:hypothetical protein